MRIQAAALFSLFILDLQAQALPHHPIYLKQRNPPAFAGKSLSNNDVVVVLQDRDDHDQRWQIRDAGNGAVQILNKGNHGCLGTIGSNTFTTGQTLDCSSGDTLWALAEKAGAYEIRKLVNGADVHQCLTLSGGNPFLGNIFIIYPCPGPAASPNTASFDFLKAP